jgi:outer membrane protein TolC
MIQKQNDKRSRWAFAAGLVLMTAFTSSGQPDSLSQWLRTALENNPVIAAAKANAEAKKKEIRIAPSLPDPTLSGEYNITPVETRTGFKPSRIGISQMVPWPAKLLIQKEIAEKEFKAAREALNSVKARILADVRAAFADYYALGKEIDITKDNLKLLQEMEKVLLSRYATAAVSQVSLLKVQVEMIVLEDQIVSLNSEEVNVRQKAIALLNLPTGTKLTFPAVLPELPVPVNVGLLIDSAVKINPAIGQARFEVEAASAQIGLARQTFAPDLMFMSDYIFTGKSNSSMAASSESGKDPWMVGVAITIPIWMGNKTARIEKAGAMKTMADAMLTDMENLTESNSASLIEGYHDAQRKIVLYAQTLIPQSQQTISLIEEAYTNDKATMLDFLDAQRMLLKLEIMLEKQRARMQTIAGKIDMLLGGTLTLTALGEKN